MTGCDYLLVTGKTSLTNERVNFSRRVDQLLKARRFPMLDALRLSFSLGKESTAHIDEWMKLAAAQGVEELKLDFIPSVYVHEPYNYYKFHVQGFNSSLKHLHLIHCRFDFSPFNSLVSVTLESILLSERLLQNILSNSSLEWLSLKRIQFSDPAVLTFAGPSLLLKHLHVSYLETVGKIDLHDINLLSFELVGSFEKLSIKNSPHMAKLVLNTLAPVEILTSIPHLEILFLTGWIKKSAPPVLHETHLPKSYVFNNLKLLVFLAQNNESDLPKLVYLLDACPLLQKLELDVS